MIVKLLTEHHLEFLILNECCRGSSESKMSKCQIVGNLMPWLKCHFLVLQRVCDEWPCDIQSTKDCILKSSSILFT